MGKEYDQKEAYNKNLDPSARLHYLENARHDADSAAYMRGKSKGPHMESNKQEKSNLLSDNPIASRASGSWMSRHSQSYMPSSSPLQQQGYNDRLDETLGAKDGKNSQSLKDRRDESEGMEKSEGKGAYSSDSKMS